MHPRPAGRRRARRVPGRRLRGARGDGPHARLGRRRSRSARSTPRSSPATRRERRVERLREFWEGVSSFPFAPTLPPSASISTARATPSTRPTRRSRCCSASPASSRRGFRRRRSSRRERAAAISYYDTAPLRDSLERLVDFDLLNSGAVRLSVGAVSVTKGNFCYFDSREQRIDARHVMASGALPPGFPPIEIDGEFYWDGGIVSNTPLQYVLDEPGTSAAPRLPGRPVRRARRDAGHPRRGERAREGHPLLQPHPAQHHLRAAPAGDRAGGAAAAGAPAGEPARRSRREAARRHSVPRPRSTSSTSSIAASTTRASRRTTSSRARRCSSTGPPASPTRRRHSRIRAGPGATAATTACTCSTWLRPRRDPPRPSLRPPASEEDPHHEQPTSGQDRHRHRRRQRHRQGDRRSSTRRRAPRSRSPT